MNLSDVSIIIAFRNASENRLRNLKTNIRALRAMENHYLNMPEIVVVEHGSCVDLEYLNIDFRDWLREEMCVRHHTIHSPATAVKDGTDPFNKSRAFNVAVRSLVHEPILMFIDADMIAHPGVYELAAEVLRTKPVEAVHMYTSFFNLSQEDSKSFELSDEFYQRMKETAVPPTGTYEVTETRLDSHSPLFGGMVAVTRRAFEIVGGCEESFEGWGGEDMAMSYKLQRLVNCAALQTDQAYHLWHEPAPGALLRGGRNEPNWSKYQEFVQRFENDPQAFFEHCQKSALTYGRLTS